MSKVLVDRELLERASRIINWLERKGQLRDDDAEALPSVADGLRQAIAQPAEAEGVEVVAYAYIDETPEDYLRTKSFVLFAGPDGGAPGPAMAHQRLEALVRLSALA